jgi:hypothetical protein
MRYVVTHTRSVGDGSSRVVATTRRYNGAINERDALVDSAREHAIKHGGGYRVVVGPNGTPDSIDVVTLRETDELVETYTVSAA